MSASQSNLSSTGFDYVVAVTQDSVNAALEQYLYYGSLPQVTLCYIYDENNNPTPIDFDTFVASANNTNPFTVPDGTPSDDPRVQDLNNALFAFAIQAQLGLPPGVPPTSLPPIVALNPGQSNVIYTMMFSVFEVTEIVFGPRGSVTWVNQTQPSGTAWTFTGTVNLNFESTSFENLPPAVQQQLEGIGNANEFGPQQLYYDLNSSDLEQDFQFNNVPSNSVLNTFMTADFIDSYWKALGGAEVLGYGAAQTSGGDPSSLAVTALNFFTPAAVGSEGAPLTLNYLCATNNDTLPATQYAGFGWNWIEPGEESQYDGVAALNRNTFANYLNTATLPSGQSLPDYVASNCYSPWVDVSMDGLDVEYQWSMTSYQTPSMTIPPTGSTILSYSYTSPTASDDAGLDGDMGAMELYSTFNLDVSVEGNVMTIVQHLVVYLYVRFLQTRASGNVVDIQITDTYSFGLNDQGQLVASTPDANAVPPTSVTVNNSQTPSGNGFLNFWADVDSIASDVATWAQSILPGNLADIPASFVENFIFPGGTTFSFVDASFSDNQDLVSHITYAS